MRKFRILRKPINFSAASLVFISSLLAFLYILSEWVFLVTKPSFLDNFSFFDKILILTNAAGLFSLLSLLLEVPFLVVASALRTSVLHRVFKALGALIPAFVLTCLVLLLVDNFTYTLFNFGIVSAAGFWRAAYLVCFIMLLWFLLRKVIDLANFIEETPLPKRKLVLVGLLFVTLVAAIFPMQFANLKEFASQSSSIQIKNPPNVILITVDSVNANRMSLYGYEKDSTPTLRKLASSSLVGMNNFSNAQGTIGSVTSILTGRHPFATRILAYEDILLDEEATMHLPGILRDAGYYTVQLSDSYYADAEKINFQDAFDEINGRKKENDTAAVIESRVLPTRYYYFFNEISTRIMDRLGHILFLKEMSNPYEIVTESDKDLNDQQKIDYALNVFDRQKGPVFIHIHWMSTHGPRYSPELQKFSIGKNPDAQGNFDDDFYLDSILEFDIAFKKLYSGLKAKGLLERTILVIASDHSQRWSVSRLPLVFRFPHNRYAGKVLTNTENLDIAPTILDYLDISQPEWMTGRSLLTRNQAKPVYIAAITSSRKDADTGKISYPEPVAPFYQFGKITLVSCNRYYLLNLETLKLNPGSVPQYSGECKNNEVNPGIAMKLISEFLVENGFDTSSLGKVEPGSQN